MNFFCKKLEEVYGIEVQLFVTKKPGLVFQIKNKKYAIEVETGSVLRVKSRMGEKLKVLKGYDNWFFIVTDRNKVKSYKEFGKTFDLRVCRKEVDKILNSQSA